MALAAIGIFVGLVLFAIMFGGSSAITSSVGSDDKPRVAGK